MSASAQLVLDAYISSDWQSITGNPAKLGLSFLSIAFDVVFLVQHFLLYPEPRAAEIDGSTADRGGGASNEREPLLSSASSEA